MKPEDHDKITGKAIEIYYEHTYSDLSAQLLMNYYKVKGAASQEDKSPLYSRATNWHFFKQNEKLQPTNLLLFKVRPTSEYRVNKLRQELEENTEKLRVTVIGRILHHIQDMSTPTHTVPVYHGPIVKDSFEDYSMKNTESELKTIDINIQEFDELKAETIHDINSIYTNAAHETLNYLYDDPSSEFEFDNGEKAGWDLFWKRYSESSDDCAKNSGFGCYGPLGKQYGNTVVQLNGTTRKIDSEVYKKLHRWVLRKQLLDSLRTFISIESQQLNNY
jgi:hypothetical protein